MGALEDRVGRLFPIRGGPRTTRVGVEHELVSADAVEGCAVGIDRLRRVVAAAGPEAAYAGVVAFEPGGQVELSMPYADSAASLARRTRSALAALRADCLRAAVTLHATPVDPRPARAVPLQLTAPRYLAMQAHFDTIGPAGRRMMRRTASTQVCLDWWPGAAGLEQWRLLNLAGPFLAAAFGRSRGPESRLATWLAVDPGRTAFDDRLLAGDDPVAAYSSFARAATAFLPGHDEHLTTLFPPVRPRGRYLEVRFLDVQEDTALEHLLSVMASLVHDEDVRRAALRRVAGEQHRLAEHWIAAAAGHPDTIALSAELVALTTGSVRADLGGAA